MRSCLNHVPSRLTRVVPRSPLGRRLTHCATGAGQLELVPTPTVLAPGGRLLTTPAAFCLERSAVSQPELSVWPTASPAP